MMLGLRNALSGMQTHANMVQAGSPALIGQPQMMFMQGGGLKQALMGQPQQDPMAELYSRLNAG